METGYVEYDADGSPCFDPTYEAWKPSENGRTGTSSHGFDPTYEAWKRLNRDEKLNIPVLFRSYL